MRPCLTCGRPTSSTRCPEHGGDGRHERSKTNGLYTSYWRRYLRPRVLERDGYLCQLALKGCLRTATTVHLDPRLMGDHRRATEADCVSACRHCHAVVDGARASR